MKVITVFVVFALAVEHLVAAINRIAASIEQTVERLERICKRIRAWFPARSERRAEIVNMRSAHSADAQRGFWLGVGLACFVMLALSLTLYSARQLHGTALPS